MMSRFPKDIIINHLHTAQEKDFQLNFLNVTKTVIKHELLEIGIIFISIWGTYGKMIIHWHRIDLAIVHAQGIS